MREKNEKEAIKIIFSIISLFFFPTNFNLFFTDWYLKSKKLF
jgi:hypothetical protein